MTTTNKGLSELRDKRATLTPHWYKRSGSPAFDKLLHSTEVHRFS